ncbi:MAG: CBS domain-containing protein [Candidatus Eremiobacteraeota bacterium]|nr:CBS domain-containing protein [Candidatus Eremiobacteraeota bacterium]
MKVKDYMTGNVITVREEDSLLQARNSMKKNQIRHLPVLNDEGKLVGIITFSNIMGYTPTQAISMNFWEMMDIISRKKVKDAMTVAPATATPDMPIEDVATLFREEKVGILPVIEENHLIGIITDTDVLNAFTDLMRMLRKEKYDFSKIHRVSKV